MIESVQISSYTSKMQRAVNHVFIWSDDKILTVEADTNKQNDTTVCTWFRRFTRRKPYHLRRMKPDGVMVWSAVDSDGSKSALVFIEVGVRVNTQVYIKMLTGSVLTWITESFGNRYVFTQDGAPSHTSNLTKHWCKDHFSRFRERNIWPLSIPNFNPLDLLSSPF